jgi:hypothetical protein
MIQLRLTFMLGLLVGIPAAAQAQPPGPGHHGFEGGDFTYLRGEMGMQKVVKGAPYSAQAVTQFTQTLADGNTIHHTNTAAVARDSEGRSRREVSFGAIGALAGSSEAPKTVFIHDPVAGSSYVLEPKTKVARMSQAPKNSTPETARTHHPGGERARANQAEIKTEDLGTQVMQGLTVQGKRITRSIAAGQVGNERAFQTVTETWYSPDLQTIVMSKSSDPRGGETVYQLTNISRAEPDATLFQVPSDYKVTQGNSVRALMRQEQ